MEKYGGERKQKWARGGFIYTVEHSVETTIKPSQFSTENDDKSVRKWGKKQANTTWLAISRVATEMSHCRFTHSLNLLRSKLENAVHIAYTL